MLNVGYDSTNYYLIGAETPNLLIDLGFPGTLPKLRQRLHQRGASLEGIEYLLVTHFHPDHAGAAEELRALGVRLVVFDLQRDFIAPMAAYLKPGQGYLPITMTDTFELKLSESRAWLKGLGLAGQVIGTPGHSDDSVSLVLDEGIAFTGDLTAPTMVSDSPLEPVRQSWARLRGLGVHTVYPGHGPSVRLE
jgi:endoribonuclease LACTB2